MKILNFLNKNEYLEQNELLEEIQANSNIIVYLKDIIDFSGIISNPNVGGMYISEQFDSRIEQESIFVNVERDHLKFYTIVLHELAHATGTKERLNRPSIAEPSIYSNDMYFYAAEEAIAEIATMKLLDYFNLINESIYEMQIYSIEFWINKGNLVDFDDLEREADKAVNFILKNWLINFRKEEKAA